MSLPSPLARCTVSSGTASAHSRGKCPARATTPRRREVEVVEEWRATAPLEWTPLLGEIEEPVEVETNQAPSSRASTSGQASVRSSRMRHRLHEAHTLGGGEQSGVHGCGTRRCGDAPRDESLHTIEIIDGLR